MMPVRYAQQKIPMESIIGTSFVRMTRLSQLVQDTFRGSNATEINLYIDMYSIVKSLYSNSHNIIITDYRSFTSTLIEMCIHYRTFFRSIGVESKIFLVMSNNIPEVNTKLCPTYNNSMKIKIGSDSHITELINDNCDMLGILCPYLPDIHFVRSTFESSTIIDSIINKEIVMGNTNPNIIISKDTLPLQLLYMYDNTVLLRPKKSAGEDVSVMISGGEDPVSIANFWKFYSDIRDLKTSNIPELIHPCNLALLMAMTTVPERNLKSVINAASARKYILNCVGMNRIKCSVQTIYDTNANMESKVASTIIESRYKALDLQFQREIFNSSVESKFILNYKNLNDPEAVKSINNKFFVKNPINLDKI